MEVNEQAWEQSAAIENMFQYSPNCPDPDSHNVSKAPHLPTETLPPIGVFWDIENCNVPRGKSAQAIVQRIRDKFFTGQREVEFMCVCDISKESKDVIQELNYAQVTVVHINATSKNAADDKLRQSLRRYANAYKAPATVILLSGDVNFAAEVSDLRYRHDHHVIVIHPNSVKDALIACVHEHYSFEELVSDIAERRNKGLQPVPELEITNLPAGRDPAHVRNRLKQLSDNCGGKVVSLKDNIAIIQFPSSDAAARAQKRMGGEDVFGSKIGSTLLPAKNASISNHSNNTFASTKLNNNSIGASKNSNGLSRPKGDGSSLSGGSVKRKVTLEKLGALRYNNGKTRHDSSSPHSRERCDRSASSDRLSSPEAPLSQANSPRQAPSPTRPSPINSSSPSNTSPPEAPPVVRGRDVRPRRRRKKRRQRRKSEGDRGPDASPEEVASASPEKASSKPRAIKAKPASLMPAKSNPVAAETAASSVSHSAPTSTRFYNPTSPTPYTRGYKHDAWGGYPGGRGLGWEYPGPRGFSPRGYYVKYPEEQWYGGECWDPPYSPRDDCTSAPPIMIEPQVPGECYPPPFRRTPGAARPSSTSSGSRPGSACSRGSFHFEPSPCGSVCDEQEFYPPYETNFQPLRSRTPSPYNHSPGGYTSGSGQGSPSRHVELMVSNLDYNISAREWKKILYAEFQQQVQVVGVYIQTQPDNTNVGYVKVHNVEDARFAISQFHRKKIGYKRIHVSLVNKEPSASTNNVRCEVVALLKEVTGYRLPLFKFIELYEKRYHRNISVSELYRMRDTIHIQEQEGAGRMVILQPSLHTTPPTSEEPPQQEEGMTESLDPPVCRTHCKEGSEMYVNALDATCLPNVKLALRSFAPQVHTLLQSHDGTMPLISFVACYTSELSPLETVDEGGVSLEHLISCVPGVKVAISPSGIKKVQWAENKPPASIEYGRYCMSPLLSQQLGQFTREIVDLLRHSAKCMMLFSKFIPNYHHHFGRQCRVADYGYTKLIELFEAIPHVVQVVGGGSRRFVTLTHRAQVKRFTAEILRVVKSQASKQIYVTDLPVVYNKIVGKPFDVTEFGISYLEDMLAELPETTLVVTGVGESMVLAIPRRDQTADEVERTKQFALEVIDLMKHSPQCRMPFNKFIPSYHHHFGKQCKVADYGFTKLIELFEAIPHVLQMQDDRDEKMLVLTEPELLKVLEEQVQTLLKSCPSRELPVPEFLAAYMKFHGHSLHLPDCGVDNVVDLINKINNIAQVESRDGKFVISLVDHSHVQQLAHRILLLLMDTPEGCMGLNELSQRFDQMFGGSFTLQEICHDLQGIVQVSNTEEQCVVKLCPLQQFARDVCTLLRNNQGKLGLDRFESAYASHFGTHLVPASYGYPSVVTLVQAIPHVAVIRGRGHRRTVLLCQDFQGNLGHFVPPRCASPKLTSDDSNIYTPSNDSGITDVKDLSEEDRDLMNFAGRSRSPYEIITGPNPSNLPSPELKPDPANTSDLIKFSSAPSINELLTLTSEEKTGQKTPLCKTPVSDLLNIAAQYLPTDTLPPLPSGARHVRSVPGERESQEEELRGNLEALSMDTDSQDDDGESDIIVSSTTRVPGTTRVAGTTNVVSPVRSPVRSPELVPPPSNTRLTGLEGEGFPLPTVPTDWVKNDSSLCESPVNSPGEGPVQSTPAKEVPATFSLPAAKMPGLGEDEGSSTSSPSPTRRLGTPRRCRLAARFSTPMSPATTPSPNTHSPNSHFPDTNSPAMSDKSL